MQNTVWNQRYLVSKKEKVIGDIIATAEYLRGCHTKNNWIYLFMQKGGRMKKSGQISE